jgi:hypothetical protein
MKAKKTKMRMLRFLMANTPLPCQIVSWGFRTIPGSNQAYASLGLFFQCSSYALFRRNANPFWEPEGHFVIVPESFRDCLKTGF